MLIFAAFTVDFGSWYTRSAEIKRAADAAALAGVVWMPEFDQAQQYALAAAAKNGFVNGQNNITVSVEDVPNNNRQLKVTIRDNKAKQFFSRLVTHSQSIGRSSTSRVRVAGAAREPEEHLRHRRPARAGSATRENFWAAVNGYCAGHESGDKKLREVRVVLDSSSSSRRATTARAQSDDDYDPDGYLYAIDLPTNASRR